MKLQNSFRDYTAESSLFVRRALVAFLGILLLTGVLIANLYNVQIVRFDDYQTRSNENRIKLVPIPPSRGIIYDRNGTPLALNRTIYQLEMMPEKVDNVQQTLDALRDVVDLTDDDIAGFKKERACSHRFTSIPVKVNLSEVQVARFAVNQYRFPGVEVKGYKRRYYPYNSALTHVIGYVSKINDKDVDRLDKEGKLANYASTHDIGKLGIERYYEDVLHGQTGYEEVEVNNRGRVIRQLKEVPPRMDATSTSPSTSSCSSISKRCWLVAAPQWWSPTRVPAPFWRWFRRRATTRTCSSTASPVKITPACSTIRTRRWSTVRRKGSIRRHRRSNRTSPSRR